MEVTRVEVVVLGLLAEEPLYGYELLERYRRRGMGTWGQVGRASVYQVLRRLERDGLVSGRSQGRASGPERRVYRVTRAGRDRLRRGLAERFADPGGYATESALALGMAHLFPTDEARRGLAAREGALRDLLVSLEAESRRLRARGERAPGERLAARMLELQRALAEAEQAWLAGYRRQLVRLTR